MSFLPRKALLAIAAVVDVALQGQQRPVAAKTSRPAMACRRDISRRVLQSLVRDGILAGIRGPRGGYELARDRHR